MFKKLEIKAGDKYHRLTVIKELPQRNKKRYFRCECDCGNFVEIWIASLIRGKTKSCGCVRKGMNKIDINNGDRYNYLTVVKEGTQKGYQRYFICKCDCGNNTEVRLGNLRNGSVKSCGCLYKKSITTHGLSKSKYKKIYKTFFSINQRCTNPNEKQFKDYGGRGIKNEFENVEQFVKWSLDNGYIIGLSIDRIDNNDNYSPSNCRWVDMKVQGNNKCTNRIIIFEDKEYTISQFTKIVFPYYQTCKTHSKEYSKVYNLINKGLSPEEIYNKLKK